MSDTLSRAARWMLIVVLAIASVSCGGLGSPNPVLQSVDISRMLGNRDNCGLLPCDCTHFRAVSRALGLLCAIRTFPQLALGPRTTCPVIQLHVHLDGENIGGHLTNGEADFSSARSSSAAISVNQSARVPTSIVRSLMWMVSC